MLKFTMFSPLSSKLSYSLTAPTRDLAPTSLLELIQLTVPAVGRNMPGSSFNRGAWVSSTNSTGSGMGYFQMLSAQTLQCCYFQLALLNAGELQGESKPPGNMECQHRPFPAKECLTHMRCQGKALLFCPETAVCHNKHHLLPLLCSSFQIK